MDSTSDFKTGDKVAYIPNHLSKENKDEMIKEDNIGEVTSTNEYFVFVKYKGKNTSEATKPEDLIIINNRQDLIDILNK